MKKLAIILVLSFLAAPGYAAIEASGTSVATGKTLRDFQREYSGTKPVVAHLKYYDYLKNAPKTTLDISHMR